MFKKVGLALSVVIAGGAVLTACSPGGDGQDGGHGGCGFVRSGQAGQNRNRAARDRRRSAVRRSAEAGDRQKAGR
ncbi:hypothetical protein [Paenibacillus thalictri]|uniref:Lipoprotein n=1 Tax=Paenibacillus thalictri TaxID=2527873 RepID=A0A4Q9DXU0_9BACL|nr:hypothetical protein [Paenibacillus thalictri]TBL80683.1 hypothetical protein EYB31_05500 [Paenibacillus thalictri]